MAQISRRAVLVGVVGVGLAACSKSSARLSAPPTPPPTVSPTPGATPSPFPSVDARPRWPLTGKLLKNEVKAHRAAVAVKVPDNRGEHPQRGIDKADIVFVELEGYRDVSGYSGTRLVPVFHSRMADGLPPVRSIRPVRPCRSPVVRGGAVLIAVAAPLVAGDPVGQRDIVATRFLPPLSTDLHGAFHPLGTDRFGRDVWARLLHGARLSASSAIRA